MISLDSTSNISIRLGEMEMFIAAPHDEKFKNLMATISPDAKYDNILQEWRISAEKLSFEELNEKLSYGIKQIEKSSMPSSKIGAIGQEHGYAEIKVGEGGEVQIDSLRERGIPDERLYFDRLEGRFPERPYLDRCLDALQPGDILYVHCLDRVARSLKQLANTVAKIESKNAYLRSLTEPFDSSADQYKYFSKHI